MISFHGNNSTEVSFHTHTVGSSLADVYYCYFFKKKKFMISPYFHDMNC